MMKDKRASHTTREKDSSYKQNKDTGRNEKRPKSMQAKRRNPAQHRGERKHDIDTSLVTYGRNSVMEFLRAGKVRQIYLKSGRHDERLQEILEEAKSRAVPIKEVEEEELDSMSGGVVHQGIAALLFPYEYQDMNAVIKKWEGKDPIFILLDGVEDVRNLGAIVRTAECAGACHSSRYENSSRRFRISSCLQDRQHTADVEVSERKRFLGCGNRHGRGKLVL